MLFQAENDHLAHYVMEKVLRNHYVIGQMSQKIEIISNRGHRVEFVKVNVD